MSYVNGLFLKVINIFVSIFVPVVFVSDVVFLVIAVVTIIIIIIIAIIIIFVISTSLLSSFSSNKAGFRPGRSCCDQVLNLTQYIDFEYESKLKTGTTLSTCQLHLIQQTLELS